MTYFLQAAEHPLHRNAPAQTSRADEEQKRAGSVSALFQSSLKRRKISPPRVGRREGRARIGVIPVPVPESGLRSPS
jgi:hypothetical protein